MNKLIKAAATLDLNTIREIMLQDSPPNSHNNCMMGILNIYYIVYANQLLADGTSFINPEHQRISEIIRNQAQTILDFFESTYPIIKSQRDVGFLHWAGWLAEPEDITIESEFESSESVLLKAGFCKIDLDLWLACQRFDLLETKLLLSKGANPDVKIPMCVNEDDLPLPEDYPSHFETNSVTWHTSGYSADFFDCYNGFQYWECGVNGDNITVTDSYLPALIQSAAFQIFYNTILPYSCIQSD